MDDRFSNRQDQALTRGFAVLMRFAWILAMALMVATLGVVGLGLGLLVGVLFGSLRLK
jgi:hypothetical protein